MQKKKKEDTKKREFKIENVTEIKRFVVLLEKIKKEKKKQRVNY